MSIFAQNKQRTLDALGKPDKSRAGNVDPQILPVLNAINETKHFYTTSSCAGRYLLIGFTESKKKRDAQWLYVDHDNVTVDSIKETIKQVPEETEVMWYRCEPPILHVCAETVEHAQVFLDEVRKIGLKRSGIISVRDNKVIMEIIGTITLAFPLYDKKSSIELTDSFLEETVKQSQKLLEENRELFNKIIDIV